MRTVLIVDDEATIRRVYEELLSNNGYRVLAVENASHAGQVLKQEVIDIMLLDIKMPEVSDEALFDVVREFHHEIRIIVASVYPIDEQRQRLPWADDYYDKAESLKLLLQKIAHFS